MISGRGKRNDAKRATENRIAYIYTSFKNTPGSLKMIPKEYLPDDYTETIRNCTFTNGGYNVYVTEKTDEFKAYDYSERFRY